MRLKILVITLAGLLLAGWHLFLQCRSSGFTYRLLTLFLVPYWTTFVLLGAGVVGAAPGSWLEYVLEQPASRVVCAADLKVIAKKFKPSVHFIQRDINDLPLDAFAPFCDKFDLVLSDMAPNTTGVKIVDQARSLELCEVAARFAAQNLRAGGAFVAKIFAGEATPDFVARLRTHFAEVKTYKPDASRDESFEFYVIGKDFQGNWSSRCSNAC
ncbi:hypothetical protein FACS1894139_19140 [Planctomycetales bacterium]|nr:hypothetical protein FACS1894139_19140 [Planctomycetales bacterium]